MQKQNVTLSLPQNLLKQAKYLATSRHSSLSELMRESLQEKVEEASGYRAAMERQLRLIQTGFDLGTNGVMNVTRDELHERR
jgi:metal-responsive CopG/Arc/MetJ family transcriptional regulator